MNITSGINEIIVALIAAAGAIIAATIQSPLPLNAQIPIIVATPFVAIIIGIVIYIMLKKAPTDNAKKRIILPVITSCIAIFGLASLSYWQFTQTEIKITYPKNDSQVDIRENISGKARNVPDKYSVWIVVYSYPDRMFYPNETEAVISNNGFTSPNTLIGAPQDVGQRFDIIALLVDQKGQIAIQKYLSNPASAGLPTLLPLGKSYDRITVTRK